MKSFREELLRFQEKLAAHEPFALARFGDGEMVILMGDHPNRARRVAGIEYQYDPADPSYDAPRRAMEEAFRYRAPGYYVGICCPHCIGDDDFTWMRSASGQDDEHLTYATLYFYGNYPHYLEHIVPLYAQYDVTLICSRDAELDRLPFPVRRDVRVSRNAWRDDAALAATLARELGEGDVRGALYLICAGPFGGVLAQQLHRASPWNTYLDAGSSLDPWLFPASRPTRRYLTPEIMTTESCDARPLRESGLLARPDIFSAAQRPEG